MFIGYFKPLSTYNLLCAVVDIFWGEISTDCESKNKEKEERKEKGRRMLSFTKEPSLLAVTSGLQNYLSKFVICWQKHQQTDFLPGQSASLCLSISTARYT